MCKGRLDPLREGLDRICAVFPQRACQAISNHFTHSLLGAIDRHIWIVGFLALLGFQIWQWLNGFFSIWLLFFIVIAATQLWSHRARPRTAAAQEYYNVPIGARIALSVLYFGLAAALVLGMSISYGLILPLGQ